MFIESSNGTANQAGTTFTANRGNASNGDLLLAFQQTNLGGGTVATPTGWTLLDRQATGTGPAAEIAVFYKTMAGDPIGYTLNGSSSGTGNSNVWIIAINGALVIPEISSKNSANIDPGPAVGLSLTTINNGDFIFGAYIIDSTFSSLSPQGFGAGDFGTLTGSGKLDVAVLTQSAAGATGNLNCNLSVSSNWAAMLVAIAGAGGSSQGGGGGGPAPAPDSPENVPVDGTPKGPALRIKSRRSGRWYGH